MLSKLGLNAIELGLNAIGGLRPQLHRVFNLSNRLYNQPLFNASYNNWRMFSHSSVPNTFPLDSSHNLLNESFLNLIKKERHTETRSKALLIGDHSADTSLFSLFSLAPAKSLNSSQTPLIKKLHLLSFPSAADPSLLALPKAYWTTPKEMMTITRKAFDLEFHKRAGVYNPKIKIVTPTKENITEYLTTLREKGINAAVELGYYPSWGENVEGCHSILEEVIQQEAMLQLMVERRLYSSIIRSNSPVREIDITSGEITLEDNSLVQADLQDIDVLYDFSSEFKKPFAFSGIPTIDILDLIKMPPDLYAKKNLITTGCNQSSILLIDYYLLKNPQPLKQLIIGISSKEHNINDVELFMKNYQAESEPIKKLNMLFGGQVPEKSLSDLLDSGVIDAIKKNRLVFFAQDSSPEFCKVNQKDGIISYEGINLATGDYVGSNTRLPIIAAAQVYPSSQIGFSNISDNATILRSKPTLSWLNQLMSKNNLTPKITKSLIKAPHEEILRYPLNNFTEACRKCYPQLFASRGLQVPQEFFTELHQELGKIDCDSINEEQYQIILKNKLEKYLPGKEEQFEAIWLEANFERDEEIFRAMNENFDYKVTEFRC